MNISNAIASKRGWLASLLVPLALALPLQSVQAQSFTTLRTWPAGSFATGWTTIVDTPNGLLYYNAQNGAGSVGRIDSTGNHVTIRSYPAGSFATGWTSIVSTPNGLLFYNAQTGAGAIGRIDSAGNHTTLATYPNGAFALGWNRVVYSPNGVLFYNPANGADRKSVV